MNFSNRDFLAVSFAILLMIFQSPGGVPPVHANPSVIHVPADYGTIEAAVNAAKSGDTILVNGGVYNESVVVGKSLSLMGQGSGTTIIDAKGLGPGVNITQTSDVVVSGFTIRNTGFFDSGVLVFDSYNVTVEHNLIDASSQSNGTYVTGSNLVTVQDNNVTGNVWGIAVQGGFDNTMAGNNATGNSVGIGVFGSQGNRIVDNQLRDRQTALELENGSTGNVLARNLIHNSTYGLWLQSSTKNLILENNVEFDNIQSYSVGVYFSSATGNAIYHNNIRRNSIQIFGVSPADLTGNSWNDGLSSPRGNFWSDYTGIDNDTDGVGDTKTPWPCPNGGPPCSSNGPPGVDYYPLMIPWQPSPLIVLAGARPLGGCPGVQGLTVNFTGSARGGIAPYTFTWSFGDSGSSSGQNVTHSYLSRGTFFPSVTAIDNTGKANGTDLVAVTVFSGGVQFNIRDSNARPISMTNVTSTVQPPGLAGFSVLTDSLGSANIPCLAPGSYKVSISHTGYQSASVVFSVANATITESITLSNPGSNFPIIWIIYSGLGAGLFVVLVIIYRYKWIGRKGILR